MILSTPTLRFLAVAVAVAATFNKLEFVTVLFGAYSLSQSNILLLSVLHRVMKHFENADLNGWWPAKIGYCLNQIYCVKQHCG
jgi:hypothetical protein